MAYERIEPMDDGWIQSAKLISFIANSLGAKPQWKLEDCYPHLGKGKKPKSPEEIFRVMETAAAAQNAYVRVHGNRAP